MKKVTVYILLLLFFSSSTSLKASNEIVINPNTTIMASINEKAHSEALIKRLNEIKKMDKSMLSPIEKKKLRAEVRVIDQELRHKRHGVFLSLATVVVILLLLIKLL